MSNEKLAKLVGKLNKQREDARNRRADLEVEIHKIDKEVRSLDDAIIGLRGLLPPDHVLDYDRCRY